MDGQEASIKKQATFQGCYLLIILSEPKNKEDKEKIIQNVAKALLSWDTSKTNCDLKELENLWTELSNKKELENNETDMLIQFSNTQMAIEILYNAQVYTVNQCLRNLLRSFTAHKQIIYSGYTFSGTGNWILNDTVFTSEDFIEQFLVSNSLKTHNDFNLGYSIHLHCQKTGDWINLPKKLESYKNCDFQINPSPGNGVPGAADLIDFLQENLLLNSNEVNYSDIVGNIRFNRPTFYIFPAGQGDSAVFGVNGFTMLIDGGFNSSPSCWSFIRHLEKIDSILITRFNENNCLGIFSIFDNLCEEKCIAPKIGQVLGNMGTLSKLNYIQEKNSDSSLEINLIKKGKLILNKLEKAGFLQPEPLIRSQENSNQFQPITLYHKVGYGTLNMYVLNPSEDSKVFKQFISQFDEKDRETFTKIFLNSDKLNFATSLANITSVCSVLVWIPVEPEEQIVRVLLPGSTPSFKIMEIFSNLQTKHSSCELNTILSQEFLTKKQFDILLKNNQPSKIDSKSISFKVNDSSLEKKRKNLSRNRSVSPSLKAPPKNIKNNFSTQFYDSLENVNPPNKAIIQKGSTRNILTKNEKNITRKIFDEKDITASKKNITKKANLVKNNNKEINKINKNNLTDKNTASKLKKNQDVISKNSQVKTKKLSHSKKESNLPDKFKSIDLNSKSKEDLAKIKKFENYNSFSQASSLSNLNSSNTIKAYLKNEYETDSLEFLNSMNTTLSKDSLEQSESNLKNYSELDDEFLLENNKNIDASLERTLWDVAAKENSNKEKDFSLSTEKLRDSIEKRSSILENMNSYLNDSDLNQSIISTSTVIEQDNNLNDKYPLLNDSDLDYKEEDAEVQKIFELGQGLKRKVIVLTNNVSNNSNFVKNQENQKVDILDFSEEEKNISDKKNLISAINEDILNDSSETKDDLLQYKMFEKISYKENENSLIVPDLTENVTTKNEINLKNNDNKQVPDQNDIEKVLKSTEEYNLKVDNKVLVLEEKNINDENDKNIIDENDKNTIDDNDKNTNDENIIDDNDKNTIDDNDKNTNDENIIDDNDKNTNDENIIDEHDKNIIDDNDKNTNDDNIIDEHDKNIIDDNDKNTNDDNVKNTNDENDENKNEIKKLSIEIETRDNKIVQKENSKDEEKIDFTDNLDDNLKNNLNQKNLLESEIAVEKEIELENKIEKINETQGSEDLSFENVKVEDFNFTKKSSLENSIITASAENNFSSKSDKDLTQKIEHESIKTENFLNDKPIQSKHNENNYTQNETNENEIYIEKENDKTINVSYEKTQIINQIANDSIEFKEKNISQHDDAETIEPKVEYSDTVLHENNYSSTTSLIDSKKTYGLDIEINEIKQDLNDDEKIKIKNNDLNKFIPDSENTFEKVDELILKEEKKDILVTDFSKEENRNHLSTQESHNNELIIEIDGRKDFGNKEVLVSLSKNDEIEHISSSENIMKENLSEDKKLESVNYTENSEITLKNEPSFAISEYKIIEKELAEDNFSIIQSTVEYSVSDKKNFLIDDIKIEEHDSVLSENIDKENLEFNNNKMNIEKDINLKDNLVDFSSKDDYLAEKVDNISSVEFEIDKNIQEKEFRENKSIIDKIENQSLKINDEKDNFNSVEIESSFSETIDEVFEDNILKRSIESDLKKNELSNGLIKIDQIVHEKELSVLSTENTTLKEEIIVKEESLELKTDDNISKSDNTNNTFAKSSVEKEKMLLIDNSKNIIEQKNKENDDFKIIIKTEIFEKPFVENLKEISPILVDEKNNQKEEKQSENLENNNSSKTPQEDCKSELKDEKTVVESKIFFNEMNSQSFEEKITSDMSDNDKVVDETKKLLEDNYELNEKKQDKIYLSKNNENKEISFDNKTEKMEKVLKNNFSTSLETKKNEIIEISPGINESKEITFENSSFEIKSKEEILEKNLHEDSVFEHLAEKKVKDEISENKIELIENDEDNFKKIKSENICPEEKGVLSSEKNSTESILEIDFEKEEKNQTAKLLKEIIVSDKTQEFSDNEKIFEGSSKIDENDFVSESKKESEFTINDLLEKNLEKPENDIFNTEKESNVIENTNKLITNLSKNDYNIEERTEIKKNLFLDNEPKTDFKISKKEVENDLFENKISQKEVELNLSAGNSYLNNLIEKNQEIKNSILKNEEIKTFESDEKLDEIIEKKESKIIEISLGKSQENNETSLQSKQKINESSQEQFKVEEKETIDDFYEPKKQEISSLEIEEKVIISENNFSEADNELKIIKKIDEKNKVIINNENKDFVSKYQEDPVVKQKNEKPNILQETFETSKLENVAIDNKKQEITSEKELDESLNDITFIEGKIVTVKVQNEESVNKESQIKIQKNITFTKLEETVDHVNEISTKKNEEPVNLNLKMVVYKNESHFEKLERKDTNNINLINETNSKREKDNLDSIDEEKNIYESSYENSNNETLLKSLEEFSDTNNLTKETFKLDESDLITDKKLSGQLKKIEEIEKPELFINYKENDENNQEKNEELDKKSSEFIIENTENLSNKDDFPQIFEKFQNTLINAEETISSTGKKENLMEKTELEFDVNFNDENLSFSKEKTEKETKINKQIIKEENESLSDVLVEKFVEINKSAIKIEPEINNGKTNLVIQEDNLEITKEKGFENKTNNFSIAQNSSVNENSLKFFVSEFREEKLEFSSEENTLSQKVEENYQKIEEINFKTNMTLNEKTPDSENKNIKEAFFEENISSTDKFELKSSLEDFEVFRITEKNVSLKDFPINNQNIQKQEVEVGCFENDQVFSQKKDITILLVESEENLTKKLSKEDIHENTKENYQDLKNERIIDFPKESFTEKEILESPIDKKFKDDTNEKKQDIEVEKIFFNESFDKDVLEENNENLKTDGNILEGIESETKNFDENAIEKNKILTKIEKSIKITEENNFILDKNKNITKIKKNLDNLEDKILIVKDDTKILEKNETLDLNEKKDLKKIDNENTRSNSIFNSEILVKENRSFSIEKNEKRKLSKPYTNDEDDLQNNLKIFSEKKLKTELKCSETDLISDQKLSDSEKNFEINDPGQSSSEIVSKEKSEENLNDNNIKQEMTIMSSEISKNFEEDKVTNAIIEKKLEKQKFQPSCSDLFAVNTKNLEQNCLLENDKEKSNIYFNTSNSDETKDRSEFITENKILDIIPTNLTLNFEPIEGNSNQTKFTTDISDRRFSDSTNYESKSNSFNRRNSENNKSFTPDKNTVIFNIDKKIKVLSDSTEIANNLKKEDNSKIKSESESILESSSSDKVKNWGDPMNLPQPKNSFFSLFKTEKNSAKTKNNILKKFWGNPMSRPSPSEPKVEKNTKTSETSIKQSMAPATSNNNQENFDNSILENEQQMLSSIYKKNISNLKPYFFDLVFIAHHGEKAYNNVDFFKKCLSKHYVLSGSNPSKKTLDAILEARKKNKSEKNENNLINIIPTHESESLFHWLTEKQKDLEDEGIEVTPSSSRCTVTLQGHEEEVCSSYRIQF